VEIEVRPIPRAAATGAPPPWSKPNPRGPHPSPMRSRSSGMLTLSGASGARPVSDRRSEQMQDLGDREDEDPERVRRHLHRRRAVRGLPGRGEGRPAGCRAYVGGKRHRATPCQGPRLGGTAGGGVEARAASPSALATSRVCRPCETGMNRSPATRGLRAHCGGGDDQDGSLEARPLGDRDRGCARSRPLRERRYVLRVRERYRASRERRRQPRPERAGQGGHTL